MSEDWTAIAAEVSDALTDIGFTVILEKAGAPTGDPWNPTPGAPTEHELSVVQNFREIRDQAGTLIGQSIRTLTVEAKGVEPSKADRVEVPAGSGNWYNIQDVRPEAQGGVAVMYEVDLAR